MQRVLRVYIMRGTNLFKEDHSLGRTNFVKRVQRYKTRWKASKNRICGILGAEQRGIEPTKSLSIDDPGCTLADMRASKENWVAKIVW